MTKIQISVSTGYVGSKKVDHIEVDEEAFDGMTPEQVENEITKQAMDHLMANMVDWDWKVVE